MLKKHNIMDYSLLLAVGKSKKYTKRADLYRKGSKSKKIHTFRHISEL